VFVPTNINNFLSMAKHSSDLPYGVCKHGNSYQASIGSGITAKSIYLGRFNTKEEAHREWQKAKLEQAIAFNFPPLQRVIDQLKFEIENNLETTSL
jgi:ribonucleotide reductase alpha subunit